MIEREHAVDVRKLRRVVEREVEVELHVRAYDRTGHRSRGGVDLDDGDVERRATTVAELTGEGEAYFLPAGIIDRLTDGDARDVERFHEWRVAGCVRTWVLVERAEHGIYRAVVAEYAIRQERLAHLRFVDVLAYERLYDDLPVQDHLAVSNHTDPVVPRPLGTRTDYEQRARLRELGEISDRAFSKPYGREGYAAYRGQLRSYGG